MKSTEIRDLSTEELKNKEVELRQEIFNLKFQKSTNQLGNTAMIGKIKKDLARVKTIINESQIPTEIKRG